MGDMEFLQMVLQRLSIFLHHNIFREMGGQTPTYNLRGKLLLSVNYNFGRMDNPVNQITI